MSDNVRDPRPQFGFLSVVGLFFLAILAVLIALYFYNADVRQAGDGAIDHARAYKRTIAADYARFYECMRGGVAAGPAQTVREGGEGERAGSAAPSVPVVVYPPYADYPTYPTYPAGGPGSRPGTAAEGSPSGSPAQYAAIGSYPSTPEYPQQSTAEPSGAGTQAPEAQTGPAMQPGPIMQAGPAMQGGPSMQGGPGMAEPGPGMSPSPMMQGGPGMAPAQSMQEGAPMQSGPGMPGGPSMRQWPPMASGGGSGMEGPGTPPQGAPGYGPGPGWQGPGMTPPGMPPAGMVAPMPYGQGSSMAPMGSQSAMGAAMPSRMPPGYGAAQQGQMYGAAPQRQMYGAGPQGQTQGAGPQAYGVGPQAYGVGPQGQMYGPGPQGQMYGAGPRPQPYGAPMYGAPQQPQRGGVAPYGAMSGAQGAAFPGPQSQYDYAPQTGAPTVVPATPTLPMTSMMPPPGDTPPTLPSQGSQADPQILAARQAYANQQHQEAVRLYRSYITRNSNDPSAFGELGNVLLAAGRPQEAAQAYYEASSRLIDLGQPGTVYLLLPHIEQQDPLLGAVLMRRLASLPRSIY